MKAHPVELRERVVRFVKNGGAKVEAAKRFDIGRQTVYRYLAAEREGRLAPRPWGGSRKRFGDDDLRREVKAKPSATLKAYGKALGVSHVAVWLRLRQLAITQKKLLRYRERDECQRWHFVRWLRELIIRCVPVYFLDECGVNHGLYNTYARASRGEKVYADIDGSRRGRTSVISASLHNRLVCPFTFEGHCNGDVVETYFREMLLPSVARGSIIVLDNAAFHRSPALLALAEAAGVELVFLPAYSPDLNPIEHIWATLKAMLRDGLEAAEDKIAFIDNACLSLCS